MKFELESPLLSTGGDATSTGSTPRLWLVAIVISFGGFLFGYNSTALNGPITKGDPGSLFELDDVEKQVATAILLVGALKGALFVNYPSERFGRRKVLLVNNIFFLIGALICGVSNWFWLLAIGRWITGLGVGVVSVLVPQLLSEISPTKIRGMVTTLHQLQITIGIALAQLIYFGFQRIDNGWRYSVALAGVPAVLQVVLMAVIPESPQWALAHQSEAEALAILQTLRPQTNYNLHEELNDMKATLEEQRRASSGSWSDLFQNKKALVIAIGGNFVQTLTGINAVMYYSSTIFKFCGITEDKLATIGLTGLNVLVTTVSVFVIEKFGRKPLLLTGTSIMFLSLSVAGVLLVGSKTSAIQEHDDELKYVTLAMVFIYVVGFAFGLGAVLWSLLGEVFPNNVRSKGMSLCLVINWSLNLLLSLTVLTAIKGMGGGDSESKVGAGGLFLIFAGLSLVGLVFMYFVFPETKGKTVEEIQQELRD